MNWEGWGRETIYNETRWSRSYIGCDQLSGSNNGGSDDPEKVRFYVKGYAFSGDGYGNYEAIDYTVNTTIWYKIDNGGWNQIYDTDGDSYKQGSLNRTTPVAIIDKNYVEIKRKYVEQKIVFATDANSPGGWFPKTTAYTPEITISPKKSYSITYNANTGNNTSTPAAQTKWHNENLTLDSKKPTKNNSAANYRYTINTNPNYPTVTNSTISTQVITPQIIYSFNKWTTSSNGSGNQYATGATYTPNTAAVLYAKWNNTLSPTVITLGSPTTPNYTFNGWYIGNTKIADPGGTYRITAAANATYDIVGNWTMNFRPPQITSINIVRGIIQNSVFVENPEGTACKANINWTNGDGTPTQLRLTLTAKGQNTKTADALSLTNTSTSATVLITDDISNSVSWTVKVTLTDSNGLTSTKTDILSPAFFTIDVLKDGHGIALGKPSDTPELLDINFNTQIYNSTPSMPVLTVSAVTMNNTTPAAVNITGATNINGATTITGATNINGTTTITGATTFSNGTVNYKSSNLTNSIAPTATTYANSKIYFRDSSNSIIGIVEPQFLSSGKQGVRMGAYRPVGSTNYSNMIYLYCNTNGSPEVAFSTGGKAAWQTALGITKGTSTTSYGTWNWVIIDDVAIAEYRQTSTHSVNNLVQWGSLYYHDFGSLDFPLTFNQIPQVSISFGMDADYIVWGAATQVSTTKAGHIYAIRVNTTTGTVKLCVTVIGKVSS